MRLACRACRGQAGDRDVGVSVVLNAKAFTPCRTPAVATVRPTWAEHEQPESTAAVGAAVPLIGSCDVGLMLEFCQRTGAACLILVRLA